jgi:hypothetical protein
VAHPPGHPLPSLLGRACALVPLGSVALRVGLASALAGAAAAAQTARLGQLVARRAGAQSHPELDGLLGAAAGLLFALGYAAAFQAVRPEVYALSTLLVVTAAYELARFDESGDPRRLGTAALACGLALSNHHLLALALVVPALLVMATRLPRSALPRLLAAGALGLGLWCYLPLRASRYPLVDWGAPTTAARFFWTVSARAFQKAVARGSTGDLGGVAAALAGELHPLGALLALGGAYVLLRQPGRRRLALLLLGGALLDAAAPALVGFDPANPDAYGYLEAAVALGAALAVGLPSVLAGTAGPRAQRAIGVALVGAAVAWGVSAMPRWTRACFWDGGAVVGAWLDRAPPRALVVTSDFQTIFAAWYLRAVEGRRPDVELVHRHFLAYPGYREQILRRSPGLAPLVGEHDVDAQALRAYTPRVVQYDLDLDRRLVADAGVVPSTVPLDEPQTRRYIAWQLFLAAHRGCALGQPAQALEQAREVLDQPQLNCDRVRDLVTIGQP